MTKLYKRNELLFVLILIGVYIVLFSIADVISEALGIIKSVTVPVGMLLSVVIYLWLRKNRLCERYGLCKPSDMRLIDFLFLLFVVSANLWNGISLNYVAEETALYIGSMLFVGFLEEVIFRGFLFKALSVESERVAIIVSSVTFGVGHIVNLLNGAELISTAIQICHATVIGYIITHIFIRTRSLWLCIAAHSLINSLDVFSAGDLSAVQLIIFTVVLIGVAVFYTYIYRRAEA